jgi:hypothetical protein
MLNECFAPLPGSTRGNPPPILLKSLFLPDKIFAPVARGAKKRYPLKPEHDYKAPEIHAIGFMRNQTPPDRLSPGGLTRANSLLTFARILLASPTPRTCVGL